MGLFNMLDALVSGGESMVGAAVDSVTPSSGSTVNDSQSSTEPNPSKDEQTPDSSDVGNKNSGGWLW